MTTATGLPERIDVKLHVEDCVAILQSLRTLYKTGTVAPDDFFMVQGTLVEACLTVGPRRLARFTFTDPDEIGIYFAARRHAGVDDGLIDN